jgi:hypothetical protein
VNSPGSTNSGQGPEPDNAAPATADWSGLRDEELPEIPEALRPYLVTDHQVHYNLTGLPAGWTYEQNDEFGSLSRWTGRLLASVALVSVGAVVAAIVVWGKAGAFGSVALICALIFAPLQLAERRLNRRIVKTELILKPPPEPRWTAAAAGMPILETYAQPAPVVLESVTPGTGFFRFPPAWVLGVCVALGYYSVITLARAASMMSAAQHDRLLAVSSLLYSLLAVWFLIWLQRNYVVEQAKPAGFGEATLRGAESGALRRSLGVWLLNRFPQNLRWPALSAFLLATGVAVTTSAFYPVPAVTSGWRIGTGAFELAGMVLVVAVALSRLAEAAVAGQGQATWSAVRYLLASVILLPVAYWLGMLNHALDSLNWIVTHLP